MIIPEELRGFETFVVSYSGGRDSTAMLLYCLANLPREQLRVVFCDTGAEWPETPSYLDYIERVLRIGIERIRAGDIERPAWSKGVSPFRFQTNLFDMVRVRGKWPSAKYRYCTTYLKRWPTTLYARTLPNPVLLFGQRAEESAVRAKMPQFDPQGNKTGNPIYRPILHWSEAQVWNYLHDHGILPNPVYNYASRRGCWCCPMARLAEVLNFCRLHPDIAQVAADLEREIGHQWTERHSITNLLAQTRAQMELFTVEPRFNLTGGRNDDELP